MMWAVWGRSDFDPMGGYLGPSWFASPYVMTLWLGRNNHPAGFFTRAEARAAIRASTVREHFRVTLVPVEVRLVAPTRNTPKRRQGRRAKVSP